MDDQKLVRTFKFRLYPSKTQQNILEEQFELCCQVYNALLGVKFEEGFSRFDLTNETLRDLKKTIPPPRPSKKIYKGPPFAPDYGCSSIILWRKR